MRKLLLQLEPVIWLLFGQGILIGTLLLTGWGLVLGVLLPLGMVPEEALSYDRALRVGGSLLGRLVLLGLAALPLWKEAHHLRSLSIDFGGAERDVWIAPLLYAIAALGSLLALVAVFRIPFPG